MTRMNRWCGANRRPLLVAAFALAFASQAGAGLTYRTETTTSGVRTRVMIGIVKVESDQSRFDITKSDEKMFETGSVILSSSTSAVVTVLNPAKKTYYVIDFAKVASSVAETQKQLAPLVTIPRPVATVKSEGAGGLVEGFPTKRWLVDASIEMKTALDNSAKQITMRSEIWTTEKLPAAAASILDSSKLPGDPVFDSLGASRAKMTGFPLKSVTVTKMTFAGSTTTSTSRTSVTGIHNATFPASDFVIPAGYKRVDSPIDTMLNAFGSR
jgi:Domain of unknown function (DUF4412)